MRASVTADRSAEALSNVVAAVDNTARIGVDVVDIAEWAQCLAAAGDELERRIYTDSELSFAEGRIERLATRFAAKEAVMKLLGTGMRGVNARDIEVVSDDSGEPRIRLAGSAEIVAAELGVETIHVSLCHESGLAYAVAVSGLRKEGSE